MKKLAALTMCLGPLIVTVGCASSDSDNNSNPLPNTQLEIGKNQLDHVIMLLEDPHDPDALINKYDDKSDYINDSSEATYDATIDAKLQNIKRP